MAVQGKKINELTAIGTVSDETVLPAVYVSGTTVNSTANKISIEQISTKVQDDMSTALAGKQDTLVSGTNIKTINNESLLGSGNLDVDGLPSQTGQSGKFLTTDGTNASWANLPSNIWTQDNLVAGTNISITKQINPNVITEDTLAVFHFDGNFNFINGADKQEHPVSDIGSLTEATTTTSRYKFGTASSTGTGWYPGYISSSKKDSNPLNNNSYVLNLEKSFTLDFWWYGESGSSTSAGLGKDRQALYISKSSAYDNYIQLDVLDYNRNTKRMQTSASVITVDTWNHIAITYDASGSTGVAKLYVNGTKVGSDLTGIVKTSSSMDFFDAIKVSGSMNGNIDELRISKGIIWDGNFTPPTQPYAVSPTGDTYEINANINLDQDINTIESTSGTIALETNKVYKATIIGNTTFTLPATVDNTKFNQIYIQLDVIGDSDDSDEPIIDLGTTNYFGEEPVITSGLSWVNYEYNAIEQAWYVGKIGGQSGGGGGADTSLSNLTAAGKEVAATMSMPSSVKVALSTSGSSGSEYTAPADGYFYISTLAGNSTTLRMTTPNLGTGGSVSNSNYGDRFFLPVAKGDVMKLEDSNGNLLRIDKLYFVYAKGSEPQQ